MREIKYRGKRIDNGEWVYGNLIYQSDAEETDGFFTLIIPQKDSNCFTDGIGDLGFECWDKVIPETVGQYTGLKDINNKKIYTGDIVREDSNIAIVRFGNYTANDNKSYINEEAYGFYLEFLSHKGVIDHATKLNYYEVISNIHDNPELLEASNGE